MDNLAWLREHMQNHVSRSGPTERTDGLLRFPSVPRSPTTREGEAAIDLVNQAAEVVKSMEDRAQETSNIAQKAVEQLELAEKRIQELEAEQQAAQACISDSRIKIQEVGEALRQERSRVEAAENHIHQLETRAIAAEARAKENESALARVEDAIRTQILGQAGSTSKNSSAGSFNVGVSRVFEGRPVR